jgi:hypothetical protein
MTIRSFKDYIINESKKKIADLDNFIKTYPNSTATYKVLGIGITDYGISLTSK